MAVKLVCECGEKVSTDRAEFTELGLLEKRLYCPACVEPAKAYLAARDALHTDVAKIWAEGLAKLREEFGAALNGGELPDAS